MGRLSDKPQPISANTLLIAVAGAIGAGLAASYAAWRAVAADSGAWAAFTEAMLFPGSLIAAAIAAIVWLGWKANID